PPLFVQLSFPVFPFSCAGVPGAESQPNRRQYQWPRS
uniref:Uncharacterized protein n=1 Tax=Amphimedon queenslandica TaxID=400682 RepID=A0A1X7SMS9_AMPQE